MFNQAEIACLVQKNGGVSSDSTLKNPSILLERQNTRSGFFGQRLTRPIKDIME